MTVSERIAEKRYRFEERLGMITDGKRQATPDERRQAHADAAKEVSEIEASEANESRLGF